MNYVKDMILQVRYQRWSPIYGQPDGEHTLLLRVEQVHDDGSASGKIVEPKRDYLSGITTGIESSIYAPFVAGAATLSDDGGKITGAVRGDRSEDHPQREMAVHEIFQHDIFAGQSPDMRLTILASFTCNWCGAANQDIPARVETSGMDESHGSPELAHVAYAQCAECNQQNMCGGALPGQDKYGNLMDEANQL